MFLVGWLLLADDIALEVDGDLLGLAVLHGGAAPDAVAVLDQ
jgi:hypothetical protein